MSDQRNNQHEIALPAGTSYHKRTPTFAALEPHRLLDALYRHVEVVRHATDRAK